MRGGRRPSVADITSLFLLSASVGERMCVKNGHSPRSAPPRHQNTVRQQGKKGHATREYLTLLQLRKNTHTHTHTESK